MNVSMLLIALAALLLAPLAQGNDLTFSARAGYDGLHKEGAAVPIIVAIRNDGPPIDGEIRLSAGNNPAGDPIVYSAPVSLPTQSDKRVFLYAHIPPFTDELTVQLLAEGQTVAETNTNRLTLAAQDELLYGVVSPQPGSFAFLETVPGGRGGAEVAFLDLGDLPDVSIAWSALDVLVLDDVDSSRLTAQQLAALRAWIENGGQLIVTGGPGGPKTAVAVSDLLPVSVLGVESVDDLPALSAFAGEPFAAPGPYVLTNSELGEGELLLEEDGRPMLARRMLGLGNVYFLALDPKLTPLSGWEGQRALWDQIAADVAGDGFGARGIQDSYSAAQAVSFIPGLRLPSVGQLLLFLAFYTFIIGPVNYFVLRRMKRRELAWVTIPALVLLFSAITFLTGFRTRGGAILNEMAIAYGSIEADQVRTQTVMGLYSPQRASYDLALPYDGVALPFSGGFGTLAGSGNLEAITRAGDLLLSGIRVDTSEVATFLADAHLPRPPLSATARTVDDGRAIELTVENNGALTLENAVAVFGQQQSSLGDVAAGETRVLRLPFVAVSARPTPDPLVPTGFTLPNPLLSDPSALLGTFEYFSDPAAYSRWQLLTSLNAVAEPAAMGVEEDIEHVTLAGWLPTSAQTVETGADDVSRTAVTLVLLEVPVR